jgi:hypothetical protein
MPAVSPVAGMPLQQAMTTTAPQTQSGYASVRMQAPDGSEQIVPAAQVDHFTSRGARVIG